MFTTLELSLISAALLARAHDLRESGEEARAEDYARTMRKCMAVLDAQAMMESICGRVENNG